MLFWASLLLVTFYLLVVNKCSSEAPVCVNVIVVGVADVVVVIVVVIVVVVVVHPRNPTLKFG